MAKANFIKERARQEGLSEFELIEKLIDMHDHKTSDVAEDLGISTEAVWMWLTSHGYKHRCVWIRPDEDRTEQTA